MNIAEQGQTFSKHFSVLLQASPTLFQLIQVFQPRQHHLLARLLNLTSQKHLVQDGIHLVKVEDQIQFANVSKEGIQHLDEEVDSF